MMIGTALMFIGFLNIFLSISGGFEINVVPLLIYFGGLAIWANSVVENPTWRYSIMAAAILLALAHVGEEALDFQNRFASTPFIMGKRSGPWMRGAMQWPPPGWMTTCC